MLRTAEPSGAVPAAAGAARKGPAAQDMLGRRGTGIVSLNDNAGGTGRPLSGTTPHGLIPAHAVPSAVGMGGPHTPPPIAIEPARTSPGAPISPATPAQGLRTMQSEHGRSMPPLRHADQQQPAALVPVLQRQLSQQSRLAGAIPRQPTTAASRSASGVSDAAPRHAPCGAAAGQRLGPQPRQQGSHPSQQQQQQQQLSTMAAQSAATAPAVQPRAELQLPPVDGRARQAAASHSRARPPTLTLVIPPDADGAAGTVPTPAGATTHSTAPQSPGQRRGSHQRVSPGGGLPSGSQRALSSASCSSQVLQEPGSARAGMARPHPANGSMLQPSASVPVQASSRPQTQQAHSQGLHAPVTSVPLHTPSQQHPRHALHSPLASVRSSTSSVDLCHAGRAASAQPAGGVQHQPSTLPVHLPPLASPAAGHPLYARQVPGTPPAVAPGPAWQQQQQQQQVIALPGPATRPLVATVPGAPPAAMPESHVPARSDGMHSSGGAPAAVALSDVWEGGGMPAALRHGPWVDLELPSQSTLHGMDWPRLQALAYATRGGTPLSRSSSGGDGSSSSGSRPGTGSCSVPRSLSSSSCRSMSGAEQYAWRLGLHPGLSAAEQHRYQQQQLPLPPAALQGLQLHGTLTPPPPSQQWWWHPSSQGYASGTPFGLPPPSGSGSMQYPSEQHAVLGGAMQPPSHMPQAVAPVGRAHSRPPPHATQQAVASAAAATAAAAAAAQNMLSIVGVNALQPYSDLQLQHLQQLPQQAPAGATRLPAGRPRQYNPPAHAQVARIADVQGSSSSGSSRSSSYTEHASGASARDWLQRQPCGPAPGRQGAAASALDVLLARMGDQATLAALRLDRSGLDPRHQSRMEDSDDGRGLVAGYVEGLPHQVLGHGNSDEYSCDGHMAYGNGVQQDVQDQREGEDDDTEKAEGADAEVEDEDGEEGFYLPGVGHVSEMGYGGGMAAAVQYYLHDSCPTAGHGGYQDGLAGYDCCEEVPTPAQWGSSSGNDRLQYSQPHSHRSHHAQHAHMHHPHVHQQYPLDSYSPAPQQVPPQVPSPQADGTYTAAMALSGNALQLLTPAPHTRASASRLSDRERYLSGGGDVDLGEDSHLTPLQRLMAAHVQHTFTLDRLEVLSGGIDAFSFGPLAGPQDMLSDLQQQQLGPLVSPYHAAATIPAPQHAVPLPSPLHSAAVHQQHHNQLLQHLRQQGIGVQGLSAGSMGSGTLGRGGVQTPARSVRLQPLLSQPQQQQQQQQQQQLLSPGLSHQHHLNGGGGDAQYRLGYLSPQYSSSMTDGGQLRPSLQQWTQHAARMLLPHSMRDMADLLLGDGWRPGLADALPSFTGVGAGGHAPGARAVPEPQHGHTSMQRLERRPVPPGGAAPQPGPRVFSKLQNKATHGDADAVQPTKHVQPSELLAGRHPPPHVRAFLTDPAAASKLLASLPGVDPQSACVQATVAALAGQPVPVHLLANAEPPAGWQGGAGGAERTPLLPTWCSSVPEQPLRWPAEGQAVQA